MSTILFGLKNCDTCRKATRWLSENGVEYTFRDIREQGPEQDEVAKWVAEHGAKVLNTRSTTWRQLSDADRVRAASDPVGLLVENPTLIKRPVLVASKVLVGFDADAYAELLS